MTAVGLLLIGILLIGLNINAIRKEKRTFSNVLEHSENNMKDYELEIGKLRKEFAETVLELQKEIEALKANKDLDLEDIYIGDIEEETKNNYKNEDYILNKNDIEYENINDDNDVINSIDTAEKKENSAKHNNVKVDEISKLLDEGLSIDEISEKIGIGKGEVLLIKELYIK